MKGEFTQKGKEAMERFKMESASEVGVSLKQGYNGDLTARQAGSIGGQMVKKMIDAYKMQLDLFPEKVRCAAFVVQRTCFFRIPAHKKAPPSGLPERRR